MIYLDNAAATKQSGAVTKKMTEMMETGYANPSSPHMLGVRTRLELTRAREHVSELLNCGGSLIFTSGGTESNNLAIFGSKPRRHAVTMVNEHSSVLNCFLELKERGLDVDIADTFPELLAAIRKETSLVSCMYVDNETGAVFPVWQIRDAVRRAGSAAQIHIDAVQGFLKLDAEPEAWDVDYLTVSAHKVHGAKGAGVLYVKNRNKLRPLHYGGGQENNIRSGTENTPAIASMSELKPLNRGHAAELNSHMRGQLRDIPGVTVNSPENGSPFILNISYRDVPSEIIINALGKYEIYASAGAACSSRTAKKKNRVRFSFSDHNTIGEIDITVNKLNEIFNEVYR